MQLVATSDGFKSTAFRHAAERLHENAVLAIAVSCLAN